MILRIAGVLLAAAAIPAGAAMVFRRLRVVLAGEISDGTIVDVAAARTGGAFVYHLAVAADDPEIGVRVVRAYREYEIDTRVRIRTHPADRGAAWLADWSHLGYELGVGLFVLLAGVLAVVAATA